LLFIPINTAAYRFISPAMSSEASALINVSRNLGGSFGISLVTTYLSRFSQVHQTTLVAHATPFDPTYRQMMDGLTHAFQAQGSTMADAAGKALAALYGLVQQQALLLAFLDDFRLLGVIFLLVIPFVFVMKGGLPGHGPAPGAH
jgi:DHA2 family multidrug resistance protein